MGNNIQAGKTGDFADKTLRKVSSAGHEIVVARVGDSYYAADNRCPHMGGDLSRGKLEGTVITCPLHKSQFDLTDGRVIRWTNWPGLIAAVGKAVRPSRPLKTYRVKTDGDNILIEV